MATLTYRTGDATAPGLGRPFILAHICNDVGAWGAGFVRAVDKRFGTGPRNAYRRMWRRLTDQGIDPLGATAYETVTTPDGISMVANMIAQHGLGRATKPFRPEALALCLDDVARNTNASTPLVVMPRIGCGLGGASWGTDVEPVIQEHLVKAGVDTVVFDLPRRPRS